MDNLPVRIIAASLALLAIALPASAAAATPAQIHTDAADGSIDGYYTVAELRAADEFATSAQQEYYGWDDAYGAYMLGLSGSAAAPGPAAPLGDDAGPESRTVPTGGKGPAVASAAPQPSLPAAPPAGPLATPAPAPGVAEGSSPDPATGSTQSVAAFDLPDSPGSDGAGWLLLVLLLAAAPLVIGGVGAWRMRSSRRERDLLRTASYG